MLNTLTGYLAKAAVAVSLLPGIALAQGSSDGAAFKGMMRCEVKDQVVMMLNQGDSNRYTHIKDSVKTGDTIDFTYIIEGYSYYGPRVYVHLDESWSRIDFPVDRTEFLARGNDGFRLISNTNSFDTSKRFIYLDAVTAKIVLNRFSKQHWHGFFTSYESGDMSKDSHFGVRTYTMHCRQRAQDWDEFVEEVTNLFE